MKINLWKKHWLRPVNYWRKGKYYNKRIGGFTYQKVCTFSFCEAEKVLLIWISMVPHKSKLRKHSNVSCYIMKQTLIILFFTLTTNSLFACLSASQNRLFPLGQTSKGLCVVETHLYRTEFRKDKEVMEMKPAWGGISYFKIYRHELRRNLLFNPWHN